MAFLGYVSTEYSPLMASSDPMSAKADVALPFETMRKKEREQKQENKQVEKKIGNETMSEG